MKVKKQVEMRCYKQRQSRKSSKYFNRDRMQTLQIPSEFLNSIFVAIIHSCYWSALFEIQFLFSRDRFGEITVGAIPASYSLLCLTQLHPLPATTSKQDRPKYVNTAPDALLLNLLPISTHTHVYICVCVCMYIGVPQNL